MAFAQLIKAKIAADGIQSLPFSKTTVSSNAPGAIGPGLAQPLKCGSEGLLIMLE